LIADEKAAAAEEARILKLEQEEEAERIKQ